MFNAIKTFIENNAVACVAAAAGAAIGSGTYAVFQHRRANRIANDLASITSEMKNTVKAAKAEGEEAKQAEAQAESSAEATDTKAK